MSSFINPHFLYTMFSLWAANNTKVNPPLPSLPKESIQEDKLNIFVQVTETKLDFKIL